MLKVYGHIYSDSEDKLKEVVSALAREGYEVAYETVNNVTIIKEVADDEQEDSTT